MNSFNLAVSYEQLVLLRKLTRPEALVFLDADEKRDALVVFMFVNAELARANAIARQCIECG